MNHDGHGLDGKVAIVTGGARGIGLATARLLVGRGASVVVADRDLAGRDAAALLGKHAIFVQLDIADEGQWRTAISHTIGHFGQVDVLVNNAGVLHAAPFLETSAADFRRVLDVNLVGCFLGMRVVAPHMLERGGSIVNLSSTAGLRGSAGVSAYAASKFGITGLTKTVAIELARHGVRVNSVHPGTTETPMLGDQNEAQRRQVVQAIPLGRVATAEEVSEVIAFLASDLSSYCTGGEFIVDGGKVAGVPAGVIQEA